MKQFMLASVAAVAFGGAFAEDVVHNVYGYHVNSETVILTPSSWRNQKDGSTPADVGFLTSGTDYLQLQSTSSGNADTQKTKMPDYDLDIYGIIWYRSWGSFTINVNGSSAIKIGAGGMNSHKNATGDRKFYVKPKIVLTADQTWAVTNDELKLYAQGGVTGNYQLRLDGDGRIAIEGGSSLTTDWPRTLISGSRFVLDKKQNLLAAGHELVFDGGRPYDARLDLSSYDQTIVSGLIDETPGSASYNEIRTTDPTTFANLCFSGTPERELLGFGGRITNAAGITWDPDDSRYVFAVSNSVSDTRGRFYVRNGVFRVTDGAALTSVSLFSVDARLEVTATAAADAIAGSSLVIADGAKVSVAEGKTLVFDTVRVGSTDLPSGQYTFANADTWLEGDGLVIVAGTHWNGGGDDDTAIDNNANWGGASVDLIGGTLTALFASGGTLATIPSTTAAIWRGIAFDSAANFSVAAEEGGTLAIGSAGIITSAGAAARTYTLATPVRLSAPQYWTVDTGDSLKVSGAISGEADKSLVKNGTGTLRLSGTNTFAGAFTIDNGAVVVGEGSTLGTADGITTIVGNKGQLLPDCVDLGHETIVIDKGGTTKAAISCQGSKPSYIRGTIDCTSGGNLNIYGASPEAPLHVSGSILGSGNFCGRDIVVDENPLRLTDRLTGKCRIVFNVSSNWIGANIFTGSEGARIRCNVPYALYRGPRGEKMGFGKSSTGNYYSRYGMNATGDQELDLGGFDQELANFAVLQPNAGCKPNVVRSDAPAQLIIWNDSTIPGNLNGYDDGVRNNYAVFEGGAGFKVCRFGSSAVNAPITLYGVNSTTGRLEIAVTSASANDTLTIATSGSWSNATAVAATSGTLVFTHENCIGRWTDVYINPTAASTGRARPGVLRLDNALPQVCRYLYVWDAESGAYVSKSTGDYSAATHAALGFAGTGVLRVKGLAGVMFFVK